VFKLRLSGVFGRDGTDLNSRLADGKLVDVTSSVARWPKFWPVSSKVVGKNKNLAGRICGRFFCQILPKMAEKGAGENF
jgi:hypothetical protein